MIAARGFCGKVVVNGFVTGYFVSRHKPELRLVSQSAEHWMPKRSKWNFLGTSETAREF